MSHDPLSSKPRLIEASCDAQDSCASFDVACSSDSGGSCQIPGGTPSAFAREQISDHRQHDGRPFLFIETICVHVDDVAACHDG